MNILINTSHATYNIRLAKTYRNMHMCTYAEQQTHWFKELHL